MENKYLDHYTEEDNEGNITFTSNELSLTSEGFMSLTYDIEQLVDKYTGVEESSFGECADIREAIMNLIHNIVNNKCDVEGYEVPYTGGDSALSQDETED